MWLAYVFAGLVGVFFCFLVLYVCVSVLLGCLPGSPPDILEGLFVGAVMVGIVVFGIWAAVLGWDDADLKFSSQSLQPWRWPLLRAPDSWSMVARVLGLWLGLVVGCFIVVYIAVGVLSFRISSDGYEIVGSDERARARKSEGLFGHYDETPIPSRHLLVPDTAQRTRDVGLQTKPAPVVSVV